MASRNWVLNSWFKNFPHKKERNQLPEQIPEIFRGFQISKSTIPVGGVLVYLRLPRFLVSEFSSANGQRDFVWAFRLSRLTHASSAQVSDFEWRDEQFREFAGLLAGVRNRCYT